MNKFVWRSPSKQELQKMVDVCMTVAQFRRRNPDWARLAIEKYYKRLK